MLFGNKSSSRSVFLFNTTRQLRLKTSYTDPLTHLFDLTDMSEFVDNWVKYRCKRQTTLSTDEQSFHYLAEHAMSLGEGFAVYRLDTHRCRRGGGDMGRDVTAMREMLSMYEHLLGCGSRSLWVLMNALHGDSFDVISASLHLTRYGTYFPAQYRDDARPADWIFEELRDQGIIESLARHNRAWFFTPDPPMDLLRMDPMSPVGRIVHETLRRDLEEAREKGDVWKELALMFLQEHSASMRLRAGPVDSFLAGFDYTNPSSSLRILRPQDVAVVRYLYNQRSSFLSALVIRTVAALQARHVPVANTFAPHIYTHLCDETQHLRDRDLL